MNLYLFSGIFLNFLLYWIYLQYERVGWLYPRLFLSFPVPYTPQRGLLTSQWRKRFWWSLCAPQGTPHKGWVEILFQITCFFIQRRAAKGSFGDFREYSTPHKGVQGGWKVYVTDFTSSGQGGWRGTRLQDKRNDPQGMSRVERR